MGDFRQNYVMASQYDTRREMLSAAASNRGASGKIVGALVTVKDNQLTIRRSDGKGTEAPVTAVKIHAPRRVSPAGIGIDVDGHFWMVEFHLVHKSTQANAGGIGAKLAAGSAFGNIKAMKVGRRLRDEFVESLRSQGAGDASDE